MPDPIRTSTRPSTSSAISASRTDGRDTPSCFARSRSGGSRAPGRVFARADEAADLLGDLPIEPAGFDALERHGAKRDSMRRGLRGAPAGRAGGGRPATALGRRLIRGPQLVKWYYQFSVDPAPASPGPTRPSAPTRRGRRARSPLRRPGPPRPSLDARHHDCRDPRHAGHRAARGADPAQQRRALGPLRAHDRRGRDRRRLRRPGRDGRRRRGRRARVRRARRLPARTRRLPARGDALRDLQPDREPLQQPHAAPRGDRVRLPRHHGPEARRAGARAARRQAARRRRVRELPVLPLPRPGNEARRGAHRRAARRARPRAAGRSTASACTS